MQRSVHPELTRDNPRSRADLRDEPCRLHPRVSESAEHRLEDARWRRIPRVRHRQERRAGSTISSRMPYPMSSTSPRANPETIADAMERLRTAADSFVTGGSKERANPVFLFGRATRGVARHSF